MTQLRKKLQDKLRRKFGYNTYTDLIQGTTLFKQDANVTKHISAKTEHKYSVITNLSIGLNRRSFEIDDGKHAIELELIEFSNYADQNKFKEVSSAEVVISFEELELIYKIAAEAKAEAEAGE